MSRYHPNRKSTDMNRFHPYRKPVDTDNTKSELAHNKKYKCPQCLKRFKTLARLYRHKNLQHPSLLLINNHNNNNDVESVYSEIDPKPNNTTPSIIPPLRYESDTESNSSTIKGDDDSKISEHPTPSPQKRVAVDETSSDSEISVNLQHAPKRKLSKDYDQNPTPQKRLAVDSSDSEISINLQPASKRKLAEGGDQIPLSNNTRLVNTNRYKQLYKQCLQKAEKWKKLYIKKRGENNHLHEEYSKCLEVNHKDKEYLRSLKADNEIIYKQLNKCKDTLDEQADKLVKCQADIISLKEEKKELKKKIEKSTNIIEQLENDHSLDAFNDISKNIFNCVSIEEIERVRKLFMRKNFPELKRKRNVKVLQRIIQGLNRGYIPICNPQRSRMTEEHEILLSNMDMATVQQMVKIIENNAEILSDLMYTIDASIKMIVNLYNKFGSRHDKSSDESSTDSDNTNTNSNSITNNSTDSDGTNNDSDSNNSTKDDQETDSNGYQSDSSIESDNSN